ncbi:MAG: amino acid ABC transporter permease [Nocardioidaceae bacterium]
MGDWTPSERQVERQRLRRSRSLRRGGLAAGLTIVVLGLLAIGVASSPGWPNVRDTYFSWSDAKASFPYVARGFWVNIQLFLVSEVLILVLALLVAVVRIFPSTALAPLRFVAVVYTDIFRGVPTLLVVFLVGFGFPALQLNGLPSDPFWLGIVALTLSYGAYVSEVMRAGIASVHPSQWASGRSLGLTYRQTLRRVVLPQALRRVTPPLLNDFISLQKDTALLSVIGVVEALRQAQIFSSRHFVFTPYVVAAAFFIVVTIPLARVTDWLALRQVRREQGAP